MDPQMMRSAADSHDATVADLQAYRNDCRRWAGAVGAEILRCHGTVAAPVAEALADHADQILGGQVSEATARHGVMGQKLVAAAGGYERVDTDGAGAVSAVAV